MRDTKYALAGLGMAVVVAGLVGEAVVIALTLAAPRPSSPFWAAVLSAPVSILYPLGYFLILASTYAGEEGFYGYVPPPSWLASQALAYIALAAILARTSRTSASEAVRVAFIVLLSHAMLLLPTPRVMMFSALFRAVGFLLLAVNVREFSRAGEEKQA